MFPWQLSLQQYLNFLNPYRILMSNTDQMHVTIIIIIIMFRTFFRWFVWFYLYWYRGCTCHAKLFFVGRRGFEESTNWTHITLSPEFVTAPAIWSLHKNAMPFNCFPHWKTCFCNGPYHCWVHNHPSHQKLFKKRGPIDRVCSHPTFITLLVVFRAGSL